MPLTPSQLTTLKTEFTTDPRGYGYSTYWTSGQDNVLADMIDTVRDGTNPPTNPTAAGGNADGHITVNYPSVDTGSIRAAVTFSAYQGLVTSTQSWLNWLTNSGNVAVNANVLQQLAGIPTANGSIWATADRTAMNAAMAALLRRFGSRAEELFGFGVVVTANDVSACRQV